MKKIVLCWANRILGACETGLYLAAYATNWSIPWLVTAFWAAIGLDVLVLGTTVYTAVKETMEALL